MRCARCPCRAHPRHSEALRPTLGKVTWSAATQCAAGDAAACHMAGTSRVCLTQLEASCRVPTVHYQRLASLVQAPHRPPGVLEVLPSLPKSQPRLCKSLIAGLIHSAGGLIISHSAFLALH